MKKKTEKKSGPVRLLRWLNNNTPGFQDHSMVLLDYENQKRVKSLLEKSPEKDPFDLMIENRGMFEVL